MNVSLVSVALNDKQMSTDCATSYVVCSHALGSGYKDVVRVVPLDTN